MDAAIFITLVVSFATFVTAHVALAFGLTVRPPRWRGPVGFVVVPLAPYWGFREGLRARSLIWLLGFGLYAAALAAGYVVAG